jgi:hypothetical protein
MGAEQNLERPDRPKGNEGGEMVIGCQDAFLAFVLLRNHVPKQGAMMFIKVAGLSGQLLAGFIGDLSACPDLAVRVRIRGAHYLALIFEDLYIAEEVTPAQVRGLSRPGRKNTFNLWTAQLRK